MWKVIIADDEKLICRLVETLVDWKSLDMELAGRAENGMEALELVRNLHPDILITDIRMPGCNGLDLIRQARELSPDIEIIIISGYAHFEYAQTAIAYGVGNYILKPIKQDELNETLQKIAGRLRKNQLNLPGIKSVYRNSQNDLKRLREGLVKDILDGNGNLTAEELIRNYHFHIEDGIFQAFLLKIDCDIHKIEEPAFSIIRRKAEEIFQSTVASVCIESLLGFQEYTGCGILNYPPENKDSVRYRLREFLQQLEACKNLFGKVEFSLGLGKYTQEADGLVRSAEEARLAVEERLIEGCGRMLERIPQSSGVQKQILLDRYVKGIEHAIDVLDAKEAVRAGAELKTTVMAVPDICGREILDIVLHAGKLLVLRIGGSYAEKIQYDFETGCRQCSKVDDLFCELGKLQENLITELQKSKENETTRPVRLAKQLIMENYQRNITLDEICEAVGFSSAYFSAMFKKVTGEGFSKYLTRVRIDKAKELLRETNMPVSEVCEAVGYNDRKHFTQTFHKATGVNPAEFRRLYG